MTAIQAQRTRQVALSRQGWAGENACLYIDFAAVVQVLGCDAVGLNLELGVETAPGKVDVEAAAIDLGRNDFVAGCAVLGGRGLQLEADLVAQAGQLVGNVGLAKEEVITVAHRDFVALQGLAERLCERIARRGRLRPTSPDQPGFGQKCIGHVALGDRALGVVTHLAVKLADFAGLFLAGDELQAGVCSTAAVDQRHANHVGRQVFGPGSCANAQGFGAAALVKRGHDDGALVDRDACGALGGLGGEVGAFDANGDQGGVEPETVFGFLGGLAGDGADLSPVEAEAHDRGIGLGGVEAEFVDGEDRVGAYADQTAVNEADVHVAVGGGLDDVALKDGVTFGKVLGWACGALHFKLAHHQGDLTDSAVGPNGQHEADSQQAGQPSFEFHAERGVHGVFVARCLF